MLSLGDNLRLSLTASVAAVGTAAYAFPLIVPWHIAIVLILAVIGVAISTTAVTKFVWCAICAVVGLLVLAGAMAAPFAGAVLAASLLARCGLRLMGAAILAIHISLVASVQELLSDFVSAAGVESAAPALVAIGILLLVRLRYVWVALTAGFLSLFLSWAALRIMLPPEAAMILAAIPASAFAIIIAGREFEIADTAASALPIAGLLLFGLMSWGWSPPRTWNDVFVILPEAPGAAEARFFQNYVEALAFAGINARQAKRPEDVSTGALLLLPWMTSPLSSESGDPIARRIGQLGRERRWTIVIAGEHTDLGGVAARIETMAGRPLLRQDLTVPRGNTDDSGPLHVLSPTAWLHEAILNRGASVQVGGLGDKVLLAGDGWWAEPNIGEWLWVGDYVWRPGDRAGRLALAVAADIDGARWVVIGDNSPFINSQIIADPRALNRLLELATLWPAFSKDVILTVFALLLFVQSVRSRFRAPYAAVAGVTAVVFAAFIHSSRSEAVRWRDSFVGQSGFDDRNFNVVLSEYPALVADRRLMRLKHPFSGALSMPEGKSLIFMLVDGAAHIGGVTLSGCRRLGSVATPEGPYLMDAQACRVDGKARVLIGKPEGAAAVAIPNENGEALIVLDTAFLAQKAPGNNAAWLLREISR